MCCVLMCVCMICCIYVCANIYILHICIHICVTRRDLALFDTESTSVYVGVLFCVGVLICIYRCVVCVCLCSVCEHGCVFVCVHDGVSSCIDSVKIDIDSMPINC